MRILVLVLLAMALSAAETRDVRGLTEAEQAKRMYLLDEVRLAQMALRAFDVDLCASVGLGSGALSQCGVDMAGEQEAPFGKVYRVEGKSK